MGEERNLRAVIVVLLLVIAFVAGFIAFSKYKEGEVRYSYKGVNGEYLIEKVKYSENATDYYITVYAGDRSYRMSFRNPPGDLEDIYLEDGLKKKVINKEWIYITQDPDTPKKTNQGSFIGLIEFGRILGTNRDGIYRINTQSALTRSIEASNVTVKTCDDVNDITGIILLELGDENKAYSRDGCVIIQGIDEKGLIMSSEKFAYHLLNVF